MTHRSGKMRSIAGGLVIALIASILGVLVSGSTLATASATSNTKECTHEWERSIPMSHTEWRFRTRVPLYGEKEIKDVKGYDFVSGGTTRVNGHVIPGHWEPSPGWHTIPDVVINAVWGPDGIPDNVLGEGNVNLRVYGGPNVVVRYNAHKVQTDEGYTDWSDWSDWSTTNPGPETDTRDVETRSVQDEPLYQRERSAEEPPRGNYPDIPWTKIPGTDEGCYECPEGTEWVDEDGDGEVDEGECEVPEEPTPASGNLDVDCKRIVTGVMNARSDRDTVFYVNTWSPGISNPRKAATSVRYVVEAGDSEPLRFRSHTGTRVTLKSGGERLDRVVVPKPCFTKVRGAVRSVDKCRTSGDLYGVRSERGVVYFADGQRIRREGVWLKTHGDRKVVVKAKPASKKFKVVGKDKWVLHFDNRPCGGPGVPPPTGERQLA